MRHPDGMKHTFLVFQDYRRRHDAHNPWLIHAGPLASELPRVSVTPATRAIFDYLATQWEQETLTAPSLERIVLNRAYQQIIGLGQDAIPLILGRLRESVGHWTWALTAISREDAAAGEETLEGARRAWLRWGQRMGYIESGVFPT
ncbi:MAG: hypothetical protein ACREN2_05665 [Candidatus Dormibacteria bacterium]